MRHCLKVVANKRNDFSYWRETESLDPSYCRVEIMLQLAELVNQRVLVKVDLENCSSILPVINLLIDLLFAQLEL
jgi:hypothetical protein